MTESQYAVLDSLNSHATTARSDKTKFDTLTDRVGEIERQWESLDPEFHAAFKSSAVGAKMALVSATEVKNYDKIVEDLQTALEDPERQATLQALEELCEVVGLSLSKRTTRAVEERLHTWGADQLRDATADFETCFDTLDGGPEILCELVREYVNDVDDRANRLVDHAGLHTQVTQLYARYEALQEIEAAFEAVTWSPEDASNLCDTHGYYADLNESAAKVKGVTGLIQTIDQASTTTSSVLPVETAVKVSLSVAFDGSFESLENALTAVATILSRLSPTSALEGAAEVAVRCEEQVDGKINSQLELATAGLPFKEVVDAHQAATEPSDQRTVEDLCLQIDSLEQVYNEWASKTASRLIHHASTAAAVAQRLPDAPEFKPLARTVDAKSVASDPGTAIGKLQAFAGWIRDIESYLEETGDGPAEVVQYWLRLEMGESIDLQSVSDAGLVDELLELTDVTLTKGGSSTDA